MRNCRIGIYWVLQTDTHAHHALPAFHPGKSFLIPRQCVCVCVARNNENAKGEQRKSCELKVARNSDVSIGADNCHASLHCEHKVHTVQTPTIVYIFAKVLSDIMTCNSIQHGSQWRMIELVNARKSLSMTARRVPFDVVVCRHRSSVAFRIQ